MLGNILSMFGGEGMADIEQLGKDFVKFMGDVRLMLESSNERLTAIEKRLAAMEEKQNA